MVRIPRAVKILKDAATPQDKDEFVHEAEVMLILRHHNLVQMVVCSESAHDLCAKVHIISHPTLSPFRVWRCSKDLGSLFSSCVPTATCQSFSRPAVPQDGD